MEDFNINELILDTLKPLNVPVYFNARKEESLPIVLFNVTGQRGYDFWDDEEQVVVYKVSINIFSKGNFVGIKNEILKLMKQAGFIRTDVPSCLYEEDIEVYNQPIFFNYYKENLN